MTDDTVGDDPDVDRARTTDLAFRAIIKIRTVVARSTSVTGRLMSESQWPMGKPTEVNSRQASDDDAPESSSSVVSNSRRSCPTTS